MPLQILNKVDDKPVQFLRMLPEDVMACMIKDVKSGPIHNRANELENVKLLPLLVMVIFKHVLLPMKLRLADSL